MKAYDRVLHDGKTVDRLTHEALLEAERRLGYPLTIVQGSYHTGVGASAGTHDGGGVIDLAPWDWQRKVKVLREVGFAAWHRTPIPGVWGEHIHAILIGNAKLSSGAQTQVREYYAGQNGLANNGPDDFARPHPIPVFHWLPTRDTRGQHFDAALRHLAAATGGPFRTARVEEAVKALRLMKPTKTTTPYKDTLSHKKPKVSRGEAVDAALDHINRARLLAGPVRRKALNTARDALLRIGEV